MTNDHVFLETVERIHLGVYRRIGKHLRRLLEGSCRNERIRRKCSLRNAEEDGLRNSGLRVANLNLAQVTALHLRIYLTQTTPVDYGPDFDTRISSIRHDKFVV